MKCYQIYMLHQPYMEVSKRTTVMDVDLNRNKEFLDSNHEATSLSVKVLYYVFWSK